jgi:cysteine-rich repeat protein
MQKRLFLGLTVAALLVACGEGNNNENCGDGVVQAPEQCDDANQIGGDGCEADCSFTVECAGVSAEALAFCNETFANEAANCTAAIQAPADFCATSFSNDIFPLLTSVAAGCERCHGVGFGPANFEIDPASLANTLTTTNGTGLLDLATETDPVDGIHRIEPNEPEASYLMHKLLGTQLEVGGEDVQMPAGLGQLCTDELASVCFWIATGALNN